MTTDIPGMTNGPIVIVEDDKDDCEILVDIFKEIGVTNEFRCFLRATEAIEYLQTTTEVPFIIISDINMPLMDGLPLKKQLIWTVASAIKEYHLCFYRQGKKVS